MECDLFRTGQCKGMIETGTVAREQSNEPNEYRLVLFRDPHSCKRMASPLVFKHPTNESAQEHRRRLLKTKMLSSHDINILAPGTPIPEA
jgi:hypothetical protein